MRILECFRIDLPEYGLARKDSVYFIRVDPEDLSIALQDILNELANFSWLSNFDKAVPLIMSKLREEDILIITADHGCDPGFKESTDHTREYIPALIFGKRIMNINLGTRCGFCDVGRTICGYLDVEADIKGESFLGKIFN